MSSLLSIAGVLCFALCSLSATAKSFDNMFVIVLENQNYEDVMNQAYFRYLSSRGRLLSNSHGLTHPSEPNYIGMISGSIKNTFLDTDVTITHRPTLVDKLEERNRTWISYQENYPAVEKGVCFTETKSGKYVRKHNPFISFPSITQNPARCSQIVPATQLYKDLAKGGQLSNFMFYTPNMDNNGHDTSLNYAANWLQGFLEPLLVHPSLSSTMFVVTFDESAAVLGLVDFHQNHIATILLGAGVEPGSVDDTYYNHYALARTLEREWGLGSLQYDSEQGFTAIGFQKILAISQSKKPESSSAVSSSTSTSSSAIISATGHVDVDAVSTTASSSPTTTAVNSMAASSLQTSTFPLSFADSNAASDELLMQTRAQNQESKPTKSDVEGYDILTSASVDADRYALAVTALHFLLLMFTM